MSFVPDHIMRWLGPAVVFALGGVAIFGNPITQHSLCDQTQNCIVTWVSALSGWAAAAAAGVTIRSLYRQADAAQKQTDFQLGDSPPTIDVLPNLGDGEELVVRIVNWNRRTILLHSLTIDPVELRFVVWKIKINGNVVPGPDGSVFDPPRVIEGWEDRQKRPNYIQLSVIAMTPNHVVVDHRQNHVGVVAEISVLGPVHQRQLLAAKYTGRLPG
ncbi:hypothetical protein [Rhizobium sp. NLR22b]|uniref:hypothetical protein n=1 Tax=Rhizobium sp. NLR22b TaxID=2731115 RepID=UPI001C82CACB|nr:hypothetical protein [Rhizobium sp. NLR22b]MBX5238653.1 hypothetical protein [Rhizobium sp. NLR22b]